MKKLILSTALLASSVFAAGTVVMPYGAYIDYSKEAAKDYGFVGGVYASKFFNKIKLELDAEHTYITYKSYAKYARNNKISIANVDYNNNDYNQNDITGIINFYLGDKFAFKLGAHSMFIDQKNNNDSFDNVYIVGLEYYKYLKYNAGMDYYASYYDGFNVKQVSPYVGFNFGNYYSPSGSFYLKFQANLIHITDKGVTGRQNYRNYNITLSNYIKNWTTTLSANFGKSAYRVENGGFVVYNLGEEYKNSFGVNVKYTWDKVNTFGVGFTYSSFKEDGVDVNSAVYLLSYSRAF
ncbi:hypothetical protein [Caminibacter pacificus]|uniref:Beta-barrel porin-2, OmpL-like. bbp2 n=1 Tax=Caminibacter pacificus TaxID=1424653 RepID=A0AAJ4RBZ8_9BACT|nr:hypothetical protein [Caminibacter pacificus]QCI28036.1 hypothetical protein C6V80_03365 [Caminibacter pacificus]ROR39775.1 hypothetical protein EDC58_0750 [Caminibacter pacificus]